MTLTPLVNETSGIISFIVSNAVLDRVVTVNFTTFEITANGLFSEIYT